MNTVSLTYGQIHFLIITLNPLENKNSWIETFMCEYGFSPFPPSFSTDGKVLCEIVNENQTLITLLKIANVK